MPDAPSSQGSPADAAPGAQAAQQARPPAAPAAGSGPAAPAASGGGVEEVVRYTLDELRASARSLLGVSKHVVAGAFALEEDVSVTLDEAKRQVETFLKEEVAHVEGGNGGS